MFKRILVILAALFTALALIGSPAQAAGGNPHFIKNATSGSLSGTDLVVKFKETGLASGVVENITLSSRVIATYECKNNGGKTPSDPKKTTISRDVSVTEPFTADKNGNITGTIKLSPPEASTVLDCPNGQTATLTKVSYTEVVLASAPSGATINLPDFSS